MLDWCKIGVSQPGVVARLSALDALVELSARPLLKRAPALRCWRWPAVRAVRVWLQNLGLRAGEIRLGVT